MTFYFGYKHKLVHFEYKIQDKIPIKAEKSYDFCSVYQEGQGFIIIKILTHQIYF